MDKMVPPGPMRTPVLVFFFFFDRDDTSRITQDAFALRFHIAGRSFNHQEHGKQDRSVGRQNNHKRINPLQRMSDFNLLWMIINDASNKQRCVAHVLTCVIHCCYPMNLFQCRGVLQQTLDVFSPDCEGSQLEKPGNSMLKLQVCRKGIRFVSTDLNK